jgi:hypothetical protein
MRKRTTATGAAPGPRAERKGKKEKKQAGSAEALSAMLSQTRAARGRLVQLAARLEIAERLIVRALTDASSNTAAPAARTAKRPAVKRAPAAGGARRSATSRTAKSSTAPRITTT